MTEKGRNNRVSQSAGGKSPTNGVRLTYLDLELVDIGGLDVSVTVLL